MVWLFNLLLGSLVLGMYITPESLALWAREVLSLPASDLFSSSGYTPLSEADFSAI